MKTVMPFSGVEKEAKGCVGSTSACVGLHCIKGEPVAFGEHFIDEVNQLPAVAGKRTRPELPSHPPAGETPGLARQIIECQLEGLEPPAETFGIDKAIGRRGGIGYGRARWPQGIIRVEMDARGIPPELSMVLAQLCEVFPWIEELEGGRGVPALADRPRRHRTRNRTRGRKLHHKAAGRDDDKARAFCSA
jgi:hypothetical protein